MKSKILFTRNGTAVCLDNTFICVKSHDEFVRNATCWVTRNVIQNRKTQQREPNENKICHQRLGSDEYAVPATSMSEGSFHWVMANQNKMIKI